MAQTSSIPSQSLLQIEEIRDGVLILKDRSMRAVLMASSLNFALKSADEQTAIIMQFQNFLNSLDFSLQFFMSSRKLNIEPYIETLREAEAKQTNELLKIQITEYIEFVRTFVRAANIVTKSFYVVVPFSPPAFGSASTSDPGNIFKNLTRSFSQVGKTKKTDPMQAEKFEEYKNQLWQRIDAVLQGLIRTGVRCAPLNTEELIELFYGLYNPGELEKGKPPPITADI